jgi:hypothetical protein
MRYEEKLNLIFITAVSSDKTWPNVLYCHFSQWKKRLYSHLGFLMLERLAKNEE